MVGTESSGRFSVTTGIPPIQLEGVASRYLCDSYHMRLLLAAMHNGTCKELDAAKCHVHYIRVAVYGFYRKTFLP